MGGRIVSWALVSRHDHSWSKFMRLHSVSWVLMMYHWRSLMHHEGSWCRMSFLDAAWVFCFAEWCGRIMHHEDSWYLVRTHDESCGLMMQTSKLLGFLFDCSDLCWSHFILGGCIKGQKVGTDSVLGSAPRAPQAPSFGGRGCAHPTSFFVAVPTSLFIGTWAFEFPFIFN